MCIAAEIFLLCNRINTAADLKSTNTMPRSLQISRLITSNLKRNGRQKRRKQITRDWPNTIPLTYFEIQDVFWLNFNDADVNVNHKRSLHKSTNVP